MLASNTTNREALTSVQRAFIVFDNFDEERFEGQKTGEPHSWRVSPLVENSGATPAVSTINYVYMDNLSDEPNEDQFRGPTANFATSYIGPKHVQGLSPAFRTEPFIFGEDLGDPIGNPRNPPPGVFLFIWGWVGYRDIFDAPHITEFCARFMGLQIRVDRKAWGWNLNSCVSHNCVDQYCPDYENIAALVLPIKKTR
jgi:hypothetical protein